MATAWRGTISFGLVNIPVTLYPAFRSREIEFHLLHKEDHGRIGYQKICKKCGKTVEQGDIVKAFEHEKDEYVPMEKGELDVGKAANTRNLEISLFTKEDEVDTILYERPYYVLPGKNAENLYILLREAIRSSGMIGIGKIQFGNKEHLAALKVEGTAIILNLMHFPEEIEQPESLNLPAQDVQVGKKELDLARQLVDTLRGHFKPEEFRDVHRERLEARIHEKVGAEQVKGAPAKGTEKERKIIDLMERLRESLKEGGKPARTGSPRRPESRRRAKPTRRRPAARKPEAAETHHRGRKAG